MISAKATVQMGVIYRLLMKCGPAVTRKKGQYGR